ncbi:MAG: hypothetical protein WEA58_04035 [Balneolaceae bacterium]
MKLVQKNSVASSPDGLGSNFFDKIQDRVAEAMEAGQKSYETTEEYKRRIDILRNGNTPENSPELYNNKAASGASKSGINPWLIAGGVATAATYGIYRLNKKNS